VEKAYRDTVSGRLVWEPLDDILWCPHKPRGEENETRYGDRFGCRIGEGLVLECAEEVIGRDRFLTIRCGNEEYKIDPQTNVAGHRIATSLKESAQALCSLVQDGQAKRELLERAYEAFTGKSAQMEAQP
jgi:hypothetical protein